METVDAHPQALSSRDALIKEALSAYLVWREACAFLDDAWLAWRDAPAHARERPFERYGLELEREARAARRYESLLAEGAALQALGT
jgi:hypothetical protein